MPYARASLQPRWSRDARHVSFQSSYVWSSGMQAFVLGVQTLQVPAPAAAAAAQQAADAAEQGPGGGVRSEARAPEQAQEAERAPGPSSSSSSSSGGDVGGQSVGPASSETGVAAGARSGSGSATEDASRPQGRRLLAGRRLLVDISGPRLSGLRHLLGEAHRAGGSQPDEDRLADWELHLFGMGPGSEEAGGAAAADALARAEELGARVVKHAEEADAGEVDFGGAGAGGANGTAARVAALSASDSDQTDIQAIAKIMAGRMSPAADALPHESRLPGALARLRCWLAGGCADAAWAGFDDAQPQPEAVPEPEPAPSVDLSQWLQEAVRPLEGDHLTLALDVDSILQVGGLPGQQGQLSLVLLRSPARVRRGELAGCAPASGTHSLLPACLPACRTTSSAGWWPTRASPS